MRYCVLSKKMRGLDSNGSLSKNRRQSSCSKHTGKMSSLEAAARPVQVSPLIKFSRWSLLLTGVLYGAYHQRRLSRRENARREQELKDKPMRDAKLAVEKKQLQAAEMKMLEEVLFMK